MSPGVCCWVLLLQGWSRCGVGAGVGAWDGWVGGARGGGGVITSVYWMSNA